MTVTIIDRRLEAGDTVELGDVQAASTSQPQGGGLRIIAAASSGESEEYVVLRFNAADGETVDTDGEVLAVTEGRGVASPAVWIAVPMEEYQ